MAAGAPASALGQQGGVVEAADEHLPACDLLLEVALQAKRGVTFGEEFGVDRAMRAVAGGATFAHGFVFENKRPALGFVAPKAAIIFSEQLGATARVGGPLVGRMALGATQFSFRDGVMVL